MIRYCMTILFAAALMVGCATTKSEMDSLVGRPIDDVTAVWGRLIQASNELMAVLPILGYLLTPTKAVLDNAEQH